MFNPFNPEFTIIILIHYKPRLVVDEDDLKWVINEKYIVLFFKQFSSTSCRKLSNFAEMQDDALMHREDLKGVKSSSSMKTRINRNITTYYLTH